jgi:protein tyrosine/serine phosphatase
MANGRLRQRLKSMFIRSRFWSVCLAILLMGGGICIWESIIKDRVIPKHFGVVEEGQLYRSGLLSAALIKNVLLKHKIKIIIALTVDSPDNSDLKAEEQAAAELGVERLTFPLRRNGTGDINNFAGAIAAIAKAKQEHKPALVRCNAGLDRTGAVIAAYRLLVERKDPSFVYQEFTRYDRDPWNDTELMKYINSHMEELAVLLKKMGVLSKIPDPLPVFGPLYSANSGTDRRG